VSESRQKSFLLGNKMGTKANYFKIGLFVLSAVLAGAVGVIVLAQIRTTPPVYLETYVDESVQGLSVGSSFKYRGVQIGRVSEISFVGSEYGLSSEYGRYVMIVVAADGKQVRGIALKTGRTVAGDENVAAALEQLVADGLRIKIVMQPLTGMAYLEADYPLNPSPPNPPLRPQGWKPKRPYIPSEKSTLTAFTESVQRAIKTLGNIDIVGIAGDIQQLLTSLNEAVTNAKIKSLSEEARGMLAEMRQTNKQIQALLESEPGQAPAAIPAAFAKLTATLESLDRTLEHVDNFATNQEADIEKAIVNIREISANLREFTEDLKRYPSRAIFGKPPSKSEVIK